MKRLFFLFLIVLPLFSPLTAWATPVCACFFGEKNNCIYEPVPAIAIDEICEAACKTKYGTQYNTHNFEANVAYAYNIVQACNEANQLASEAKPKQDPIIPKLEVDIPGFTFSPPVEFQGSLHVNFLGEYIQGMYKYLISFSFIIAIVFLMIGGLQWALGAASAEQLSKAKKRIKDAISGLVLLFAVVLILTIVNPQLIIFDPLTIQTIPTISPEMYFDAGDVVTSDGDLPDVPESERTGKFFDGVKICTSPADCVTWCKNNPDKSQWPDSNKKTISIASTQPIPNAPGLKSRKTARATPEMIEALKKAGQIAISKNPNYKLEVGNSFRDLKTQIQIVCDKVKLADSKADAAAKAKILNEIGFMVSYPGASNHGSGNAVDVALLEGSKTIATRDKATQGLPQYQEGGKIFADIMAEAGMIRVAHEMWHFELEGKTNPTCRCKGSAQCPSPPKKQC